jgi:hypothetical protein
MKENKSNEEEHNKRVRQGRISKNKGNNAERKYAKIFREAGWGDALTMRQVSKLKDDRKIDLHAVPVNMQIKAGIHKGMNISQVLREIKEAVVKLPPHFPEHQYHATLLHDKGATFHPGKGWKSTEFDAIVSMTFKDYFELLCMLHNKNNIKPVFIILDEENNIISPEELK